MFQSFLFGMQEPRLRLLYFSAGAISFATWGWMALHTNYAAEQLNGGGFFQGLTHTIREIPGFLAFTVVLLILFVREQRLLLISVVTLGLWVAATAIWPDQRWFLLTTLVMSIGFHFGETLVQSLSLQWSTERTAPQVLATLVALRNATTLLALAILWLLLQFLDLSYAWAFGIMGGITALIALWAWLAFPQFKQDVPQRKGLVLRRRYWLYYALTFMSGARRQIFIVFAAKLLLDRFGTQVHTIAWLMLITAALNLCFAPLIGRFIARLGERRALVVEYLGLIVVFTAYAYVSTVWMGLTLYVIDHLFFALAIAMNSYFKRIAAPEDMAATAGVSFTINHIAAVVIPVALGLLWEADPRAVFLTGTAIALGSLLLACLIPRHPKAGQETINVPRLNPALTTIFKRRL